MTPKKSVPKSKAALAAGTTSRKSPASKRVNTGTSPSLSNGEIDVEAFEKLGTPEPMPSAAPVLPTSADATPASAVQPASGAPASAADALTILEGASEASTPTLNQTPSSGADDAAASILSEAATSAESSAPRKGGWPKGKPRKPMATAAHTAFPSAQPLPVGADAKDREIAKLRAKVAGFEQRPSPEVLQAQLSASFAGLTTVAFNFLARRRGAHWKLQAEEVQEISDAAAAAAAPYVDYIAPAMPIIVLAGAVYSAVAPRLEVDEAIEAGTALRVMPASEGASNA